MNTFIFRNPVKTRSETLTKFFFKKAGAEMCQAHIKLWFGLVRLGLVRHGLVWLGIVWRGMVGLGFGIVWFTCKD